MAPFDDPIFNINFVRIVQRYPCIWKHSLPEYNQRNITEKAWAEVAREVKDNVLNCRERWRNIRGSFIRSLKNPTTSTGIRKKYYLSEYMDFITPYVKIKPQYPSEYLEDTSSDHAETEDPDSQIDQKPPVFADFNLTEEASTSNGLAADEFFVDPEKMFDKKRKLEDVEDCSRRSVEEAVADWIRSVREKERRESEDANLAFFRCLLPDVMKMNDRQNRQFRRRVMKVVDEILEGEDGRNSPNKGKS
ncbi:uncharacterized protein [Euwallacea fornicatus]|uniref:uncharacterized protein isoform X1 n=1 Tax=Euwallacea fornicatus TaxID=995702 RepID=UPI00338EABD0